VDERFSVVVVTLPTQLKRIKTTMVGKTQLEILQS
jgi:hypothetical protein